MNIDPSLPVRRTNNFDFIRLLVATFVLAGHSSDALLNKPLDPDPAKLIFGFSLQSIGVLIFFIISGYLVTASFENKTSWLKFFMSRVLRVFPALIVVVLLSVFVLGPCLTTVNLDEYFSSRLTHQYLQNMTLYRMYYYLPGVFENNPIGGSINASLWTLPYEFTCYLYIAIAGLITFVSNKWVSLTLFILYFSAYLFFTDPIDKIIIPVLGIDFKTFFLPFLYFLMGSVFYKFSDQVKFNITGVIACLTLITFINFKIFHHMFMIPVIAYLVLMLAFSKRIKLNEFGKHGDFSYGLYLYAFPVQQLIVYLTTANLGLFSMMLLSFIFTMPFAYASWRYIEKPALQLKKRLR